MDAPKCKICNERHYGLCPGSKRPRPTAVEAMASRVTPIKNPRADAKPVSAGYEDGRTVGLIPATGAKPKRGRPRIGEPPRSRPWEALGMSRSTWWRRQREKKNGVPPK